MTNTLRQQMGSNAAEYARNYDWEKIAKQIVGVYKELIGNAGLRFLSFGLMVINYWHSLLINQQPNNQFQLIYSFRVTMVALQTPYYQ